MVDGAMLAPTEVPLAQAVGVHHPEQVRIREVVSLPLPGDPELQSAGRTLGLFGPNIVGLTLGYGIYIIAGHRSPRLVAHECRHVQQFEARDGSMHKFLEEYLWQVVAYGYESAPLEIDARMHEHGLV